MLFNLSRRKIVRRKKEIRLIKSTTIGGGAIDFTPGDLPNLVSWFLPEDMDWLNKPLNDTLKWSDSKIPGGGVQGAARESIPNVQIQSLNGYNVFNYLTHRIVDYVTNIQAAPTPMINRTNFTAGYILKQSTAAAGLTCHQFRGSVLGSNTVGLFLANGNLLRYYIRSNNAQTAIVDSVTNWNGAGYKIVFITFDYVTKTLTMYEGGNIISVQNLLMDNFVYQVNAAYGFFQNALSPPSGWWVGGLGEFFLYNDVKSTARINLLGTYFSNKYALPWIPV